MVVPVGAISMRMTNKRRPAIRTWRGCGARIGLRLTIVQAQLSARAVCLDLIRPAVACGGFSRTVGSQGSM